MVFAFTFTCDAVERVSFFFAETHTLTHTRAYLYTCHITYTHTLLRRTTLPFSSLVKFVSIRILLRSQMNCFDERMNRIFKRAWCVFVHEPRRTHHCENIENVERVFIEPYKYIDCTTMALTINRKRFDFVVLFPTFSSVFFPSFVCLFFITS